MAFGDDKGDCLRFRFAHRLGGCRAPFGLVQKFVRSLMDKGSELLGLRLPW